MTIKQQINHESIQRVCHLYNVNFTLSPPLCYSLKITNYGLREKKIFCINGCFSVSRYVKGGRKSHF